MTGYELSRDWFDWCFENKKELSFNNVVSSKVSSLNDYSNGGFYMIETQYGSYIGKSINYIALSKKVTLLNERIYGHLQIV